MRKLVVLITGAGGEIGHGLISRLAESGTSSVVTLDLNPLEPAQARLVRREFTGSILDAPLLDRILAEFEIDLVFHLAALLSTRSEFTPVTAHQVNVEGMLNLLEFAQQRSASRTAGPSSFLYPSSIAAYGLPDLDAKHRAGRVTEDEFTHPTTMYGCNKLYCEQLGRYYARHYKQLAADDAGGSRRFPRAAFPGLISAVTVPSGRHLRLRAGDAARRGPGRAVRLLRAARHAHPVHGHARRRRCAADACRRAAQRLTRTAYNVGAFNPSAEEIRAEVAAARFPEAEISFDVDLKRQGIVDCWPADVDDSAGAARLGLLAGLRLRYGVHGLPDPDDQGTIHEGREGDHEGVRRITKTKGLRRTRRIDEVMRILAVALAAMTMTGQLMPTADPLKGVSERYVKLVLAVGLHDADYVDAYYGPPEWRAQVQSEHPALGEIDKRAEALMADVAKAPALPLVKADAELWRLRLQYLERQLAALRARVSMLQGKRLTFDEESRALYDAVAPRHTELEFDAIVVKLEATVPGGGPLIQRYEKFKEAFVIPRDRLDAGVSQCHSRVPRPDDWGDRVARGRELYRGIRDRQIVEWLQLVPGQLQKPDSGEHRFADLHRSGHRSRVS